MVNAGILPATVSITQRANLWANAFHDIIPHPDVVDRQGREFWRGRRARTIQSSRHLVDEFARTHAAGTSFGNTLMRRYLQSTQWITNPTNEEQIKKFDQLATFFKTYASQYGFDYLMVVAQGYQESMLNQAARNGGAVGIMQIKPSTAAAPPISIPNVVTAENNIHAGVKALKTIADQYFSDPNIDPQNRLLLTFAAYNCGPNRIADLRKQAAQQGLDPDKWFGNVELIVSQRVGQTTVQYVSNIYKYYVAYKLVVEQGESLQ